MGPYSKFHEFPLADCKFGAICYTDVCLSLISSLLMMIDHDNDDDGWFLADEDFWEGWWSVLACSLVAVETNSWCPHPSALWTHEGLGWGWKGCCLIALSASCVFPVRLNVSLPRTYKWFISLVSARRLGLRSPATMADGRFPPVQAVSWAELCISLSWIPQVMKHQSDLYRCPF